MKHQELTRRQFVATGLTAACGPLILPSRAWGAAAPSERINVAQIGAGGRGSDHLKAYLKESNAQIVAVCDCFASRREDRTNKVNDYYADAFGKTSYNGCQSYRDFREILVRDDIDAVSIATPDHWHVPIAMAAVKAGKDVYVEKPLGVSVVWNQALRKAVNGEKAVFQYGTQQRSQRNFRFACELVRSGYIGKLERMDVWAPDISTQYKSFHVKRYGSTEEIPVPADLDYDLWLGPAPVSPYTSDRCSCYGAWHVYDNALGFIAGWGAHPLDIAQWGNNTDETAPIAYEGTGRIPKKGLFDTIESWDIHCRYANGVTMHFMDHRIAKPIISRYRSYKEHGTTFFGSEGWISVDRGGIYASNPTLLDIELKNDDVHLYESKNQIGNFVECVKSRKKTISSVEAAVQSDMISHLANACIRTGRSIQWDPAKEKIIDDKEATLMLDRPLRSPWKI